MNKRKIWDLILFSVGFLAIVLTIFTSNDVLIKTFESINYLFIILFVIILLFVVLVLIYSFRITSRNPPPINIAILGFPGYGKTVYLSILFDELQKYHDKHFTFAPYGQETLENVADNLNLLSSGNWLPRTEFNSLNYFRAFVVTSTYFFKFPYKIEIADYAGEHMNGVKKKENERWLHKSSYFKYVSQSDAIMFFFDTQDLIESKLSKIEKIQNAYITALQLLIENKGVSIEKKLNAPIAIIFTKVDLLKDTSKEKLRELEFFIDKFLSVCKNRCKTHKTFFVSSVGEITRDGKPPVILKPFGVTEPFIWSINNYLKF